METCSMVPHPTRAIKNSDNASARFSVAFFSVSPWEKTSSTGHDATYHRAFLITLMGGLTVMGPAPSVLYNNALDTIHRLWHVLNVATITLHNIDPALKTEAMTIMKRHGLTASDAVSAFLRKIVNDHESGLSCFCCDLDPNKETAQDLEGARAGRVKYITSQDTDDLFKKLGI